MNKQHKWHKEIKHWADGGEIEWRWLPSMEGTTDNWRLYQKGNNLNFFTESVEYRIKPQPREPQYLYVYARFGEVVSMYDAPRGWAEDYIGKIKLEVDDD